MFSNSSPSKRNPFASMQCRSPLSPNFQGYPNSLLELSHGVPVKILNATCLENIIQLYASLIDPAATDVLLSFSGLYVTQILDLRRVFLFLPQQVNSDRIFYARRENQTLLSIAKDIPLTLYKVVIPDTNLRKSARWVSCPLKHKCRRLIRNPLGLFSVSFPSSFQALW